jgi:hypothetical protein
VTAGCIAVLLALAMLAPFLFAYRLQVERNYIERAYRERERERVARMVARMEGRTK